MSALLFGALLLGDVYRVPLLKRGTVPRKTQQELCQHTTAVLKAIRHWVASGVARDGLLGIFNTSCDSTATSWSGGCDVPVRVGGVSNSEDGSYVVCNPSQLLAGASSSGRALGCLVVSVGSKGEASFERRVHQIAPHCLVDIWDGTLIGSRKHMTKGIPKFANFLARNFETDSWSNYSHTKHVPLLKIDCEGCEMDTLAPWLEHGPCTDQIVMEIHPWPWLEKPREYAADSTAAALRVPRYDRFGRLMALLADKYDPIFGVSNSAGGPWSGARCAHMSWQRRQACA